MLFKYETIHADDPDRNSVRILTLDELEEDAPKIHALIPSYLTADDFWELELTVDLTEVRVSLMGAEQITTYRVEESWADDPEENKIRDLTHERLMDEHPWIPGFMKNEDVEFEFTSYQEGYHFKLMLTSRAEAKRILK